LSGFLSGFLGGVVLNEYSAVVTNKAIGGPALWAFMCDRGIHEKVYGELKSGFAFACVPTLQYAANSAWQLKSVLAFNLSRSFPRATTARRRAPSHKRWALFGFETIHTLRALCFQRAGVLTHPQGRAILDVGSAAAVKERFQAPRPPLGSLTFCHIEVSGAELTPD
jgi:hypothetical protein